MVDFAQDISWTSVKVLARSHLVEPLSQLSCSPRLPFDALSLSFESEAFQYNADSRA